MKKLDSYRLLDLFIQVTLTALTIVATFMVSLGYNQISRYVPEIEAFPYFIAFVPAFAGSLIHAIINFFGAMKHNHHLIDLARVPAGKHGHNSLYLAIFGALITLVFFVLFFTGAIYSEEYLYVLVGCAMGLFPYAYYLFFEIKNIAKSDMEKKSKILRFVVIGLCVAPIILALATYFPGVIGWSYLGMCFIPLSYVIGDAACMDKEYSDMNEKDDL